MSAPTVSTRLAQIAEQSCGQQRVMRLGWERLRSLASGRVLTNRMREYFTYGSVGGAGGNPGSYPAASGGIALLFQSTRLVAAVAELGSLGRFIRHAGILSHHVNGSGGSRRLLRELLLSPVSTATARLSSRETVGQFADIADVFFFGGRPVVFEFDKLLEL